MWHVELRLLLAGSSALAQFLFSFSFLSFFFLRFVLPFLLYFCLYFSFFFIFLLLSFFFFLLPSFFLSSPPSSPLPPLFFPMSRPECSCTGQATSPSGFFSYCQGVVVSCDQCCCGHWWAVSQLFIIKWPHSDHCSVVWPRAIENMT